MAPPLEQRRAQQIAAGRRRAPSQALATVVLAAVAAASEGGDPHIPSRFPEAVTGRRLWQTPPKPPAPPLPPAIPPHPPVDSLPCNVPRLSAIMSSTVHATLHQAAECIDGDLNTFCATAAGANNWISVRISPTVHVGYVTIDNRQDSEAAQAFLSPFEVRPPRRRAAHSATDRAVAASFPSHIMCSARARVNLSHAFHLTSCAARARACQSQPCVPSEELH